MDPPSLVAVADVVDVAILAEELDVAVGVAAPWPCPSVGRRSQRQLARSLLPRGQNPHS